MKINRAVTTRAAVCNYNLAGRTLAIICIWVSIVAEKLEITVTPRYQFVVLMFVHSQIREIMAWKSYR